MAGRPNRRKGFKRLTWTVRRVPDGWEPVILLGEIPVLLPIQPTKAEARRAARAHAATTVPAGS